MNAYMLRRSMVAATMVAAVCLGGVGVASADVLGDCTLTGYTFMAGSGSYASTAENNQGKNYFLAQPLEYDYNGSNMWGYAWIKLEVGDTTVDSAYLVLDLLGVGSMQVSDATEENPATLEIYSPGEVDVEDLYGDSDLLASLQEALAGDTSLYGELVITSNGTCCLDITDLYNSWVTGEVENNGLVLVSDGSKYAGFGNDSGSAPYISSEIVGTLVPEPATVGMMIAGSMGLLLRRRRKG